MKSVLETNFQKLSCAVLAVATLFVSGCSDLLNGSAEINKPIKIEKADTACVKDLANNIKGWIETGTNDIGASIDCSIRAIDHFTEHVEGQKSESYSKGELSQFIKEYLAKAQSDLANDSIGWTSEILRIKQLAIGGGTDRITRAEVQRLRSILVSVKPMLVELSPDIPVVLFKPEKVASGRAVKAGAAIEQLMIFFAEEFEKSEPGRPVWTASEVLKSVKRIGVENDKLDSWIPLAEQAKSLLVGGDKESVQPNEWPKIFRKVGHLWKLSLELQYDVIANEDTRGAGLPSLERVVFAALDVLEQGLRVQPGQVIENKRLYELINTLHAKDLLPKKLSTTTIKNLIPIGLGKFLYGVSKNDSSEVARALRLVHVRNARAIARDWFEGQKALLSSLDRMNVLPAKSLAHGVGAYNPQGLKDAESLAIVRRAKVQLQELLTKGRPLARDERGRLIVAPEREIPSLGRDDIDMLNTVRVLVSTILRGYTKHSGAAEAIGGLTDTEAQSVYLDLKELGKDLGLMDVRNNTAGTRTFMEAGIFASVSNGNSRLELQEGIEWFHFVLGGGSSADKIHESIVAKSGCRNPKLDIFGRNKINLECFRREFVREFNDRFVNMPRMLRWVKDGSRQASILSALEKAGRTKGVTNDPVDSSEMRVMLPVLHYTESLFATHDKNLNDKLDEHELWAAFPIIRPFIEKMANGKASDIEIQKAIYSYLITFGEPPKPGIIDTGKLIAWRFLHGFFKDEADRLDVINVIGSFGIAARRDRVSKIEAYLKKTRSTLRTSILARDAKTQKEMTELLQCLEPAYPLVGELLRSKIDVLAPGGKTLEAEQFLAHVKPRLEADAKLEQLCLPF